MNGIARPHHSGIVKFGLEADMLSPTATSLPTAPSLAHVGYATVPNVKVPTGAQNVDATGTPYPVQTVYGDVEPSFKISNLKLGNIDFIKYLIRSSGIDQSFHCMPVLALAAGAANSCSTTMAFTWLARFCMCNSWSMRCQEGAGNPVSIDAEFLALCVDKDAAAQTVSLAELNAAGGKILTWANVDLIAGGQSYRPYLRSVNLSVNHNVKRDGSRPELGVTNPVSRATQELVPGNEVLTVSYNFRKELPSALRGDWGTVVMQAADSTKTLTLTIDNNVLQEEAIDGGENNQTFSFTVPTASRVLNVNTSFN